jgi:hypothetical protein
VQKAEIGPRTLFFFSGEFNAGRMHDGGKTVVEGGRVGFIHVHLEEGGTCCAFIHILEIFPSCFRVEGRGEFTMLL